MKSDHSRSIPKRILIYSLSIIGGILLLLGSIIAIALHTVLSPSRLTPLVLEQAQNLLHPKVSAESVELTFFSSFPQFQLHIKEGQIASEKDTLVRFHEIGIGLRPLRYLTHHQIYIHEISIKEAEIHAVIDRQGFPNWDIIKQDSISQPVDTTQNTALPPIDGIKIDQISFEKVNLHFSDEVNNVQFDLADLNAAFAGDFGKTDNELDIRMKAGNIRFVQGGKVLANRLTVGIESHVQLNVPSHLLKTDKMTLNINGIEAGCAGFLQKDTLRNEYDMNIHWGLNIPSLADALKLIPKSIVKDAVNVETTGNILVTGSLKGIYGNGVFPVADLTASIDKGSFQYKGLPYGVDRLDLKANGIIDLNQKANSYLTVTNFLFKGASSELQLSGAVKQLLTDPQFNIQLNTNVDFTSLAKTLPFEETVKMEGIIDSKLNGKFALSSVTNRDFGKLGLEGYLKVSEVKLESPVDSFFVNIQSAGLAFGTNRENKEIAQGKNLLNAIIGFDGLDVNTRLGSARMDSVRMTVKSSPLKDTTAVATMEASIGMKYFEALSNDSMGIKSSKSKIALKIKPSLSDKKLPVIESDMLFDSIQFDAPGHSAVLRKAGFVLQSEKGTKYQKQWLSVGKIGFGGFQAYSTAFPLPISMPRSVLTLHKNELTLQNAGLKVGNSDMRLTGKFINLEKAFFERGTLIGDYELTSSFIDCNELARALKISSFQSDTTQIAIAQPSATTADSMSVFVVPERVDFTMHTRIDKVQLGHMVIENINGDIVMRNQTIQLDSLKMHTLAADMISTLVYRAKESSSAYTGFDVKMKDIQVGKLVELMPALDTLVPMLRSLDGIVNFHIAAETSLGADMTPIIPSIQGAANLRGDSLVLMDGETFSEISKMLRFKNKERNVIDSVSVDMIVRNGQIEIYPFRITMDRYVAAVGGKHNLDMSFNYHVSLLQSPIPFKVGVDVKGNMEDFKFRLTKPKYKDLHQITRLSPVDSTSIGLRQRIKQVLQKVE